METGASAATSSATFAGQSGSEATTPAAYADEDARHFAITASQVPKPTGTSISPPIPSTTAMSTDSLSSKESKPVGTRFHEDCHETDMQSPRLRSSRMFRGKGKEAVSILQEKKKPVRLLDLPVDILKDIVREVTHTNDLTSLALCHSALHRLAVPHIYSRFDIVWPDSSTHAETRSGVDALTYGLATLVMAEEIFGEAPGQRQSRNNRYSTSGEKATDMQIRRRRGNHYAQFTRKFSLGNGPADWVQEYLITKEGGKMLGTLVALAVARMRSLETFIWDMPTGILRDVWLALSSLGERGDGLPCRLEKVWVRWHDNSIDSVNTGPPPLPVPINNASQAQAHPSTQDHFTADRLAAQVHPAALDRVEHPNFSMLPPLKSLSVLDIDELAYLDEMSVLIGRSLDKLRELRVGIARHALAKHWVTVWEGDGVQQVDANYPTAGSLTIGEKRLGGVLGTLTGFVHDMRTPRRSSASRLRQRRTNLRSSNDTEQAAHSQPSLEIEQEPEPEPEPVQTPVVLDPDTTSTILSGITSLRDVLPDVPTTEPGQPAAWLSQRQSPSGPDTALESDPLVAVSSQHASPAAPSTPYTAASQDPVQQVQQENDVEPTEVDDCHQQLHNALHLESLELERVPLAIPVLQKAFDWTTLTSLTLLHCQNHEQLWKTLRKQFPPTPRSPIYPQARRTSAVTSKKSGRHASAALDAEMSYALNIKKIHINTVSSSLISFLKETLAPNSLEVLFLQETRSYSSSVTVDAIFKGPLKRHRNSLKKLLIDSSEKGSDGLPTASSRWRRWMLNREILAFIVGGRMPALKELGAALDYRDWHFFLQRLPSVPHLRSLYVPFLADHVHGANVDPRELALQVVDIVALRPEVELCYMGIANKCFEILENRREATDGRTESAMGMGPSGIEDPAAEDDGEDDEEDEGDVVIVEEVDEVDDDDEEGQTETDDDDDDQDDEDDDSDTSSMDGGSKGAARLRLREILFYDDKVAVFKARHGRL